MNAQADRELDVRQLPKPQKHPKIFGLFDELSVGQSFVLINDHDPKHLHDEFEVKHPGGYAWEYLNREPRNWQIAITKIAETQATDLPAESGIPAGAQALPVIEE